MQKAFPAVSGTYYNDVLAFVKRIFLRALPVLVLSGKDSKGRPATAAVMCDPEGNGPGHLEHSL
jgi:hypothetical protein